MIDPNNLFLICFNHNTFMTDINLDDLKACVTDMLTTLTKLK